MHTGPLECRWILGVGDDVFLPSKMRKLSPASLPDSLSQVRVAVACEILKGCRLTVFLAHKEERDVGNQEDGCGNGVQGIRHHGAQAVADGPIPDLIVILGEHDELGGRSPA